MANSSLAQLVEHLVYIQSVVGSSPTGTTIVSVMATHRKLRYNARLVNKRYTERKESYGRIRRKSPRLNLLRLCKVKSTWPVRISVSSSDFHSEKRGSIPLRATKTFGDGVKKRKILVLTI